MVKLGSMNGHSGKGWHKQHQVALFQLPFHTTCMAWCSDASTLWTSQHKVQAEISVCDLVLVTWTETGALHDDTMLGRLPIKSKVSNYLMSSAVSSLSASLDS